MSATDYFFLPVIGLLLVGLLAMVLRWAHRPAPSGRAGRPVVGQHGMLVPVTTVHDPVTAQLMVKALRAAGIAATTTGPSSEQLLLVWPAQTEAARDLLVRLAREKQ